MAILGFVYHLGSKIYSVVNACVFHKILDI